MWGLWLVLLRGDDYRDGITEFHNVIDQDFDVISAGGFEFDLAENGDVSGVEGGVLQDEFDFAFAQLSNLIRSDEADCFSELTDTRGPAVEQAEFQSDDGELWDANEIDDADQEEVPSYFLADFFAQQ